MMHQTPPDSAALSAPLRTLNLAPYWPPSPRATVRRPLEVKARAAA